MALAMTHAEDSAERASLTYISDEEPGLMRKRSGRGFRYVGADGKAVKDKSTLDRIGALVIPPAWTDVWICTDEDGHIQATGRDQRGRKQYRYHPRWSACRDDVKYSGLASFAAALPKLRAQVDADLRRRTLSRERVIASIVWLLDNTLIRVGNATYARDNKSFGLTTLRNRHVQIEGAKLRFAFKGKSGKEWNLGLTDRRIARVVRSIQELPGQHLFQYIDDDGQRRRVHSQDVNAYIRETTANDFSSKHFRTWGGTLRAATLFADTALPESQRGRAQATNAVVDVVSQRLGNTRAVCRKCYIHPKVFSAWEDGLLAEQLTELKRKRRKVPDGLDPEEALVMWWLAEQATT
jgi:DNA topoisomerase I